MRMLAASEVETCIHNSVRAFNTFKNSSRGERSLLLRRIAEGIEARRPDLRKALILEAKKPYSISEVEISRAINTFMLAAEEAKRYGGELIPMDTDAGTREYGTAVSQWFPRGPILAITPYNFPLNLVAHKVAPALAVGASIVVKPPPQAPTAAFILEEIFEKAAEGTQIPKTALQVVQAANETMSKAVADERFSVFSFTGSDSVGWMLKEKAGKKKVVLELGGNAAVIVHSDGDLARAALRSAIGGFAYAGQVCISVQRIFVQNSVLPQFTEIFSEEVKKLKVGDPLFTDTVVGPVIDEKAADKIMNWVEKAKSAGAKLLCGGTRQGALVQPTVLMNVSRDQELFTEEVFGPVVIVNGYEKFEDAVKAVNDSRFGLQAGIFTDSLKLMEYAFRELRTGGVVINDAPTFRADHMPYGGTKDSGEGREGVKYAMEEFSEKKTLIKWNGECL